MKKHNYSAGPCILPQEVFEKSAQAILNFNDSGLSLLEISHRSKDFVAVMEEARALVLELLDLKGKGYQAIFLGGGASLEFLMVPYNLMKENGKAAYLDTGTWASAAIKEAKFFGETVIVASSKEENYNHIRGSIFTGIGGTYASGYLSGLIRAGYEFRFAKRFGLSLNLGFKPNTSAFLSGTTTGTIGGFEYGVGVNILF